MRMSNQPDTFQDPGVELVCVVAHVSTIGSDGWARSTHLPRFYVERKGNSWDGVARDVHTIIARGESFDVAHLAFSTATETAIRSVDLAGNVA